jgi:hypothetical protein
LHVQTTPNVQERIRAVEAVDVARTEAAIELHQRTELKTIVIVVAFDDERRRRLRAGVQRAERQGCRRETLNSQDRQPT